jgi:uncharacterized oxidoreductase
MEIHGNTILITGASAGIGLALAEAFLNADNRVLICGRREHKLAEAKAKLPGLEYRVCDVSKRQEREELFRWATSRFSEVNVVFNNAGIQRETDFLTGAAELTDGESEIETNLTATLHLCALFTPYFRSQPGPCAIGIVTSGLAFIPLRIVPVYCATKAALHSFSLSLRSQLSDTNVRVFEVIPPLVNTELHRGAEARKQGARGIAPSRVAAAALQGMKKDRFEIRIGRARDLVWASRIAPQLFHRMLNRVVE